MAPFKLLFSFAIIMILVSCVRNDPEPDNKQFLISGEDAFGKTWRISQIQIELGTLNPLQCLSDNFITYFPNGNYEINEGASKCDPSDPPAVVGTWEMNAFETKIFVEIDDSIQIWNIESIDKHSHSISSQFVEGERIYSLSAVN